MTIPKPVIADPVHMMKQLIIAEQIIKDFFASQKLQLIKRDLDQPRCGPMDYLELNGL